MKVFVTQPEWPITQLCVSVLHTDVCLAYKEQLDYMKSFNFYVLTQLDTDVSVICHSCLFTIITPLRTVSMNIFKVNETCLINVLVYMKAYKKQMYTSKTISRD